MSDYDDRICSRHRNTFLLLCVKIYALASFPIETSLAAPHQQPTGSILHLTDGMQNLTCGQVCMFDAWFQRAHCENNVFNYVPIFRGCEGAVMLELQGNRISYLSAASLVGYEHVRTLDLTGNAITSVLSGTFSRMNNLENILIPKNYIQEIENYTFTGTEGSLKRIYLTYNEISVIWENAFRGLGKVRSMYLSNNKIFRLPTSLFWDMHDLRSLYLGTNNLEYLSKNVFNGLTRLEIITLDSNNLRWIPIGLFNGLKSLREVTISQNQLVTIPSPQRMGIQANLDRLDLRNNNLSKIGEVVPYLNVSKEVYFYDNPFECNCTFINLQERFLGMDYQIRSKEKNFVDQYQEGCLWNASSVSFQNYFFLECQFNDSNEPSIDTNYVTNFNTDNNNGISLTEMPSTLTPFSVSRSLLLTNTSDAFLDITIEKRQEIILIYIATVLTLFFFLWMAKTTCDLFVKKKTTEV